MVTKIRKTGHGRDTYFELVQTFPLRPIRSDEELDQAIRMIDSLLDRKKLDIDEEDYLEVLSGLVKRYEAEEHPMRPLSDADLLRHLIEAKGATQAEVAEATGIVESTISAVLAGKRALNRVHIGKVARYFSIEPGAFFNEKSCI